MRFSNALVLGLSALTLTFCKRNDEVTPTEAQSEERTVGTESITQFHYVIKPDQQSVDGSTLNLPAGAVVGIEAGTRGSLLLKNFVGADGNPITIVNKGGKAIIKSSGSYGLKVENSKHIRITGTGDDANKYGLEINGGHITLTMDKLSTNFEIDHLEIHNAGFAGIMAKTDPSCDPATWRGNFTMRNVSLHDNYVYDVKGEGFYVGNSFYASGRSLSCGTIKPHDVENVKIYNNITKNSGAEGIQVGCVIRGAEVFNNTVELYGQDPFSSAQDNGIQIGEGTGGKLYNNIVKNGAGNGLIILGYGDNQIFNNVVINAGARGAFVDERFTPGPGFAFYNNTFINSKEDGITFYSEQVSMNYFVNNIIVNPGNGVFVNTKSGTRLTQSNNLFTKNINEVKFVSPSTYNFALQVGSPAIDKGLDVSAKGISFDYNKAARPQGAGYDIGAYEFGSSTPVVTNPTPSTTPTAPTTPTTPTSPVASITSYTLIDATTDRDIATITDGYVLDLSKVSTREFNIRVNTASKVGSVLMNLNNQVKTESYAPLTYFGDAGTDYKPGSLPAGSFTFSGTTYSAAGGTGTKGGTVTVKFAVVNGTTTTPTPTTPVVPTVPTGSPITSFTLIDATTEKDIATITPGYVLDRAAIGVRYFNIRANVSGSVGSVVLNLNTLRRVESEAPYTMYGDSNGNYNSGTLTAGTYIVKATPYSRTGGSGTAGVPFSITFTVK